MGRLTPSFRVVYGEVMEELRREIRNSFVDLQHKKAFDLLYKEAWRPEETPSWAGQCRRKSPAKEESEIEPFAIIIFLGEI